jgi:arabinose-5-phosphate isomerase
MSNNQTVESRLIPLSKLPLISKEDNLKKALDLMTEKRLGIALIIDSDKKLLGVLTDGDLRRLLLTRQDPLPALLVSPAITYGNKSPKSVSVDTTIDLAREKMVAEEIWDLPVVSSDGVVLGLLHRHSLG